MIKSIKAHNLRLDKIIYATEASAIATTCLLVYLFVSDYFYSAKVKPAFQVISVLVCVIYSLYMGLGNYKRLKHINKLEK